MNICTPTKFNIVTRIGNLLVAAFRCRGGHDFEAQEPEWFHDGSGSRKHSCQRCKRVEIEATL